MGVIFISHSSKNNAEAVAVRDWLRGEGYAETFLDLDPQHGLAPGQRWEEELQKAGERCLAVVVLVSPEWCASKWCFHEFKFAKALGKKIFPVLIQPTPSADLPLELTSQFQMANISVPELREDGLMRLRIGLQRAGLDPKHFVLPEGRPPYRGLKALEEEDAAIFFGRDAQITAGLDALRQMRGGTPQRILTIAAASGAGKSSFLKAGLLARLKRDEENFFVLPTWRPERDALSGENGLARSLGATEPAAAIRALEARQTAVTDRFQSMAAAANDTWQGSPPTLVLPLDQAEELFSADNATASAAISLLLGALAAKLDLVVVATIRSDALGSLQADSRLAAQLRLFNLPALPPSAFREVIEGPARLANPPLSIDAALTDRLISDLDKADALPLLAFTLERLVTDYGRDRTISLREYETGLGGISGAINAAVEAALRKAEADPALPSTRHELDSLARAAFIPWLVQLDEADASPRRRVARLADLPTTTHRLIQHFIDERLLVSQNVGGQTIVEVSHEAVLRHWRGLAAWISEERIVLEGLHRIIRSANEWMRNEKTLQARSGDLLVHRGERLRAAEAYLQRPDMASALQGWPLEYLKACRVTEDEAAEKDRQQAEREKRQRRRAVRWQSAAGLILIAGFAALAFAGLFLVNERRAYGKAQSLMLARTAGQFEAAGDYQRAVLLSILASRDSVLSPASPEALTSYASSAQGIMQSIAMAHQGVVSGAVLSKNESRILSWSDDKSARLWSTTTGRQIGRAFQHEYAVRGAAFSNDEARIVTWSGENTRNPDDSLIRSFGDAKLWDASSGQQIGPTLQHDGIVDGAIFSPDNTRILTWSTDKTAKLWDAATGEQIAPPLLHKGLVRGASFSKDGTRILTWGPVYLYSDGQLLSGAYLGEAKLWDTVTGTQIGQDLKHKRPVGGALFSNDGTRILSWSWDGTAKMWDLETSHQLGPTFAHNDAIQGAALTKDDARILTWSWDGTAKLWDTTTGQQLVPDLQHADRVVGASFSDDEAKILTWSWDGTARLWDAATGQQMAPDLQHTDRLSGATFSKDETKVLTWSKDNTARLWDVETGFQTAEALTHEGAVNGATIMEDEDRILTWSDDNILRLWRLSDSIVLKQVARQGGWIGGVTLTKDWTRFLSWTSSTTEQVGQAELRDTATGVQVGPAFQHDFIHGAMLSKDESSILTWSWDGAAKLWDVTTGDQIGRDLRHEKSVNGAAFSQDKTHILTWSDDHTARLWDAATGAQIGPALQHEGSVYGAAFSNNETRILTWSDDNTARLWDAGTGTQIGPALQHEGWVSGAAFSKNETRILTWSSDDTARLWDAATGAQIGPALQHENSVKGAVFSNDETLILTWSNDNTARLWDAATGGQIGPALQHEDGLNGATFSKDETRILTWSDDHTARLWDAATGAQIGPALRHENGVKGAAFSKDETQILTWTVFETARLWDLQRAMVMIPGEADFAKVCETNLQGSLARDKQGRMTPFPRLIDAKMVEAAPILRGREGEDVCRPPAKHFWEHPFQAMLAFVSKE